MTATGASLDLDAIRTEIAAKIATAIRIDVFAYPPDGPHLPCGMVRFAPGYAVDYHQSHGPNGTATVKLEVELRCSGLDVDAERWATQAMSTGTELSVHDALSADDYQLPGLPWVSAKIAGCSAPVLVDAGDRKWTSITFAVEAMCPKKG